MGVWMHVFSFLCVRDSDFFRRNFTVFYPNMTSPTGQICLWNIHGTFPVDIPSIFGKSPSEIPGNIPK